MAEQILYNAGMFASNFEKAGRVYAKLSPVEKQMRDRNLYFLESYHYVGSGKYAQKMRKEGVKVFLDSGAFTAWSQKTTIDLGKYCDFCIKNKDIIRFPSVLDVIDFDNKDRATKGTYWNQNEMEQRFRAAGVSFDETGAGPLPAVHYGEPDEVVQYYASKYKYIAFGGLVPVVTPQMIHWLDRMFWRYIVDQDTGRPKVRVHGFGITSLPVMKRYPWYSVDSSTWLQWSANGMILLPQHEAQLNISNKSSARKVQGQHIDNLRPIQRDSLEKELLSIGSEPDRLRDLYYSRWAYNSWAFPYYINQHGFARRFFPEQLPIPNYAEAI